MKNPKKVLFVTIVFCSAIIVPSIINIVMEVVNGGRPIIKSILVVVLLIALCFFFYRFLKKQDEL